MIDRLQSLMPGAPLPDLNPAPEASRPMMMVEVTNRNGFPLRDMFDGVPYIFRANEPNSIPPQVAHHIFGWPGEGDHMRLHTCRRFGWNTPEHLERDRNRPHDLRTVADIYFENIDIKTVEYDLVRREPSALPMPEDSEFAERPEMDARAASSLDRPIGGDPTGETTRAGFGRHSRVEV